MIIIIIIIIIIYIYISMPYVCTTWWFQPLKKRDNDEIGAPFCNICGHTVLLKHHLFVYPKQNDSLGII